MKKSLAVFVSISALFMVACANATPVTTSEPTTAPEIVATPEPTPTPELAPIPTTNYFTMETVETDLDSRQWLDLQYMDYSGGWSWDFGTKTIGDKTVQHAFRNEVGMYVYYILYKSGETLYVFRTEHVGDDDALSAELESKLENLK